MSNILTTARMAVWDACEADATLQAAIGVNADKRTWSAGELLRTMVTTKTFAAPLFWFVPAKSDPAPWGNAQDVWTYRIQCLFANPGPSVEVCEAVLVRLTDLVRDPVERCFGLATDGLDKVRVESATIEAILDNETLLGWRLDATLAITLRRVRRGLQE